MKLKYSKGFTLIELMVVSTILAMLAVIVIVNLEKARVKSRDTQRKADLTKLAGALDTYKMDKKTYILSGAMADIGSSLDALKNENYIATIPVDPVNDATHKYQYRGEAARYKLRVLSENIKTNDANAQTKAGDFYNSCGNCDIRYYQISTDQTALTW